MRDDDQAILDALIIGAGFAGICLGKRLLDAGLPNFRIVEKALSGTGQVVRGVGDAIAVGAGGAIRLGDPGGHRAGVHCHRI